VPTVAAPKPLPDCHFSAIGPVYSRSSRLRRADPANASCADRTLRARARPEDRFLRLAPRKYSSTPVSLRTHSSQSSPSVAISIVSKIGWSARSGKNGSAGSESAGRAGSIVFWLSLYLMCQARAVVVCRCSLHAGQKAAATVSLLRVPPVPARARRFQQGSFGRLHSDECRRAN
jgi:hypothetical protein